ncbi:cyclase family protein [Martensiomyces pterosporus]|nr:cyclase family protein [Martensiomyces pterosporus]
MAAAGLLVLTSMQVLAVPAASGPSETATADAHAYKQLTKPYRIPRPASLPAGQGTSGDMLWHLYNLVLSHSRYIDLTHTIRPDMPIWREFGNITFSQAVHKDTGEPFTYEKDLFVANAYKLTTDQMGTQLDAPAHFNPYYAAADEIPPTFALRKLVVIDMSEKVRRNSSYALSVQDVLDWEIEHGTVPSGSVVFVRSDWSKAWPHVDTDVFPQVHLDTVQFLHLNRSILFHGHEPLDTDMTPRFDSERWLLSHGYAQAEGITNLDQVAPTGCLLSTGFPKFAGGTGNYVRYVAICPPEWKSGLTPGSVDEAPLAKYNSPLEWNEQKGCRSRS